MLTQTYGNGDTVRYAYDTFDRLVSKTLADGDVVRYYYNAEGAVARIARERDGVEQDGYEFTYDSLGRLIRSEQYGTTAQRTEHRYDAYGRLSSRSWVLGDRSFSETYGYNDGASGDGTLSTLTAATGDTLQYGYDALRRLQSVAVGSRFTTAYAYEALANGNTASRIQYRNVRLSGSGTLLEGAKYTYDACGNITRISRSTDPFYPLADYVYDAQNQLTRETYYDGAGTGSSHVTDDYVYTYDTAGNLLTVSKNGSVIKRYHYANSEWKDLLTSITVGNTTYALSYDRRGDLTSYANGRGLYSGIQWENGYQLASIDVDSDDVYSLDFLYDVNGVRTKKTVNNEIHEYITQNGKVVREIIRTNGKTQTEVLDFFYDESGRPFALNYSSNSGTSFATYYYILNLQGDVVKLISAANTVVASYTYDAWGNILSSSGTMAKINPLRYRGYYYDEVLAFYYLQSRYYDPANRRFISADSLASTGQGFVGTNMFAYCNNNPVRYEDSGGTLPTVSINTVRADTGATRPDNYVEPEAMSFYNKNREFIDQRIERYVSENSTVEILYAGSFRITDSNRENGALWNGLSAGALKGIAGAFLFIPSLFPGQKLITEAAVIVIEYLISKYIGRGENKNLPNGYYEHYTIFIDTPYVTYGEPGVKTTIVDMYWAWIDDSSNSVAFVFRVDHF